MSPSMASAALTCCSPSGCSVSSFLPMSDSVRPSADISTGLPGGPSACEASDELVRLTATLSTPPEPLTWPMRASASRLPNGLTPLNSFCARPSQKLRKLKTALTAEGVLRPVVRRTSTPLTLKSPSAAPNDWLSTESVSVTPLNFEGSTPCEPTTSPLVIGKSDAVRTELAPLPLNAPPCGLIWLRLRLSAPALKWHEAHAWRPSLPACMSQNRALPSRVATPLSRMKRSTPGTFGTSEGERAAICSPPPEGVAPEAGSPATASSATLARPTRAETDRICRRSRSRLQKPMKRSFQEGGLNRSWTPSLGAGIRTPGALNASPRTFSCEAGGEDFSSKEQIAFEFSSHPSSRIHAHDPCAGSRRLSACARCARDGARAPRGDRGRGRRLGRDRDAREGARAAPRRRRPGPAHAAHERP